MNKKISKKTNKNKNSKNEKMKKKQTTSPKIINTISLSKSKLKELIDKKWIRVNVILEILGAPKEHVSNTINQIISLISKSPSNSIKLLKYEIESPENVGKTADGKTELFSSFAELEIMFNKLETLTEFCFTYMPSSIEIIDPTTLELRNKTLSIVFNDLQAKLHAVDRVAKELRSENIVLKRNAGLLLRNNILISLRNSKKKNLDEISKLTGIPKEQLKPFLDGMIKEGFLKKEKEEYVRIK